MLKYNLLMLYAVLFNFFWSKWSLLLPFKKHFRVQYLLKAIIKNPKVIVEAGAADGRDTQLLSKLFPKSVIHAIEPLGEYYKVINNLRNSHANIIPHQFAFNSSNGKYEMYVSSRKGRAWGSSSLMAPLLHLDEHPEIEFNEILDVDTFTLDDFIEINRIDIIDILWFDLQGKEPEVLMSSKYLNKIACIYTEVSKLELYKNQILFNEYHKFLIDNGFYLKSDYSDFDGNALYLNKNLAYLCK